MKATHLKGSSHDRNKRNKLKYRGEDTVTVDRTEEEDVDRTTVTGFERDSLHPGHAIDEGGLHYQPDTDVDQAEGTYGDTIRRGPVEESPGGLIYEEEIYKLRKRSGSPRSQAIWEIEEERARGELPADDMHDARGSDYYNGDRRVARPNLGDNPLSPNPIDSAVDAPDWLTRFGLDPNEPPPWLKVYQRLLNWAIVWPFSEFDGAVQSCQRGEQVDEVALSIWTTQVYKRYVRSQLTQYPPRPVDKMFVPPNLTDAINNAVYNGRHADAAGMLRDLWYPFGFSGSPRVILALGRHRREDNHWVAHRCVRLFTTRGTELMGSDRFSLTEGQILTYDCYMERTLSDSRVRGCLDEFQILLMLLFISPWAGGSLSVLRSPTNSIRLPRGSLSGSSRSTAPFNCSLTTLWGPAVFGATCSWAQNPSA